VVKACSAFRHGGRECWTPTGVRVGVGGRTAIGHSLAGVKALVEVIGWRCVGAVGDGRVPAGVQGGEEGWCRSTPGGSESLRALEKGACRVLGAGVGVQRLRRGWV
jgi:hypothetical protein